MDRQQALDLINERIQDDAIAAKDALIGSLQLLAQRASEAVERLEADEIGRDRYCSVADIMRGNVAQMNALDTQLRLLTEQVIEFRAIAKAAK